MESVTDFAWQEVNTSVVNGRVCARQGDARGFLGHKPQQEGIYTQEDKPPVVDHLTGQKRDSDDVCSGSSSR